MRVIAGRLGGRQFSSPSGHRTHPMSDKVRGALFNMLGDISGLSVLDAFAGSGAIAIEAVSRGAERVIAVDADKNANATVAANVSQLGIDKQIKSIRANVSSWSDNNPNEQFDLVICDPPYDRVQLPVLRKLARHVAPDGAYVLSWPGSQEKPGLPGLSCVTAKSYGDAQLVVYKHQ